MAQRGRAPVVALPRRYGRQRAECRVVGAGVQMALAGPRFGVEVRHATDVEGVVVVRLDPATYECSVDGAELTGLVREALEEVGPDVAYFRRSVPKRFRVIVTCPGPAGGDSHEHVVEGTYRR